MLLRRLMMANIVGINRCFTNTHFLPCKGTKNFVLLNELCSKKLEIFSTYLVIEWKLKD